MLGIAPPRHRANPLQPAMNPLKMAPLREKSHRNFWKPRRGGGEGGTARGSPVTRTHGSRRRSPSSLPPSLAVSGGAGEAPAAGIASSRLSPAQPNPSRLGPGPVPAVPERARSRGAPSAASWPPPPPPSKDSADSRRRAESGSRRSVPCWRTSGGGAWSSGGRGRGYANDVLKRQDSCHGSSSQVRPEITFGNVLT